MEVGNRAGTLTKVCKRRLHPVNMDGNLFLFRRKGWVSFQTSSRRCRAADGEVQAM